MVVPLGRTEEEALKRPLLRMCVVCRAFREKKSFLRLSQQKSGFIIVDSDGRAGGKGIYLCIPCIKSFLNDKRLRRRYHGKISDDDRARLGSLAGEMPLSEDRGNKQTG